MLHKKKMTVRSLFRYPLGNQRPSGRRAEWLVNLKRKCSTKKDTIRCLFFVELEGIEPSSKRGNNTLSTCLSLPLIFVRRQDQGHQPIGLSSKSYLPCEAKANQFRFIRTSVSNSLETTAFGRCLVLAPCAKIKLIYYYSIKQQEHNCYCQL